MGTGRDDFTGAFATTVTTTLTLRYHTLGKVDLGAKRYVRIYQLMGPWSMISISGSRTAKPQSFQLPWYLRENTIRYTSLTGSPSLVGRAYAMTCFQIRLFVESSQNLKSSRWMIMQNIESKRNTKT